MSIEFIPNDYRSGYYWHALFGWMKDIRVMPERRSDREQNRAYRDRRKIVRRKSDRDTEQYIAQQT